MIFKIHDLDFLKYFSDNYYDLPLSPGFGLTSTSGTSRFVCSQYALSSISRTSSVSLHILFDCSCKKVFRIYNAQ